MLQPKRTKFRKQQKGKIKGLATRGATIAFGSFGIKTTMEGFITSRQLEAARVAVTRFMKREGKVWIRIFPSKPVTKKPYQLNACHMYDDTTAAVKERWPQYYRGKRTP